MFAIGHVSVATFPTGVLNIDLLFPPLRKYSQNSIFCKLPRINIHCNCGLGWVVLIYHPSSLQSATVLYMYNGVSTSDCVSYILPILRYSIHHGIHVKLAMALEEFAEAVSAFQLC